MPQIAQTYPKAVIINLVFPLEQQVLMDCSPVCCERKPRTGTAAAAATSAAALLLLLLLLLLLALYCCRGCCPAAAATAAAAAAAAGVELSSDLNPLPRGAAGGGADARSDACLPAVLCGFQLSLPGDPPQECLHSAGKGGGEGVEGRACKGSPHGRRAALHALLAVCAIRRVETPSRFKLPRLLPS